MRKYVKLLKCSQDTHWSAHRSSKLNDSSWNLVTIGMFQGGFYAELKCIWAPLCTPNSKLLLLIEILVCYQLFFTMGGFPLQKQRGLLWNLQSLSCSCVRSPQKETERPECLWPLQIIMALWAFSSSLVRFRGRLNPRNPQCTGHSSGTAAGSTDKTPQSAFQKHSHHTPAHQLGWLEHTPRVSGVGHQDNSLTLLTDSASGFVAVTAAFLTSLWLLCFPEHMFSVPGCTWPSGMEVSYSDSYHRCVWIIPNYLFNCDNRVWGHLKIMQLCVFPVI